jgi:hypothetical protein
MSQLIRETDMAFRSGGRTVADGSNSLDLPRKSEDNMSRSNPDLTQLTPRPLVIGRLADKDAAEENSGAEAQTPLAIPPRRSSRAKEDDLNTERRKSHSVPPPTNVRNPPSPAADVDGHSPSPLVPAAPRPILESSINVHANSHNQTPPLKPSDISHRFQRQSSSRPRRPSKTARWAIPDNVTDILTGNVFRRQEVDELLTPEQLVMLKRQREEEARRKEEELRTRRYSGESENAQGPSGKEDAAPRGDHKSHKSQPSHSRSLSSPGSQPSQGDFTEKDGSGSASETSAASDDVARSSEEKRSSVSEDDEDVRPPTPPRKSERRLQKHVAEGNKAGTDELDEDEGLKTVDFLEVPTPCDELDNPILPPKNPRRYSRQPEKELPAIPKQESSKKDDDKVSVSLAPEEDDEFFYLKSTPYSLTAPCFRHGRIALAKSEVGKGAPTMDETLDWTAFQMAILGAGEFLSDLYDEGDSKLVEDIKEWYGDLGFETYGLLIPEAWQSSPRSSQSSLSSLEEHDLPSPHQAQNLGFDATRLFQGKNPQWQPQHQQACSERPQVVEDDGTASMGYNLQGDLGNFLQWEAQHALSPGHYGS